MRQLSGSSVHSDDLPTRATMLTSKRPAHAIESSDGNQTKDELLNSRANSRTSTHDVTEIEEDD